MKILYFHQHFSTPNGGSGIRSYEMARRLVSHGHQVTMVCGSYDGGHTGLTQPFKNGMRRGNVDGIDVIELELFYSNDHNFVKRSATFIKFAFRSVRLSFTEKYDLIFATSTPLTAGIPGIFSRWLRGKPFVFEVRDLWPECPREMGVITNPVVLRILSALEWASYRSAHRLIGLAPGIIDGIARRGVPRDSIALIPNGCDIDLFSDVPHPWRPPGVAQSDFMAVFTGSHGIANGLDAVLDAASELRRRGRDDVKLVLIGKGKLKPHLERRAKEENLSNVIFHPPVNKRRLAGLLASADMGLQVLMDVPAFYFGTSPNKFFDYIAAGLPVLNNYPGWVAGLIEENRCGFVVPPRDSSAFADAIEAAASDPRELAKMGKRSRLLAETQFSRAQLAERFVEFLVECEATFGPTPKTRPASSERSGS